MTEMPKAAREAAIEVTRASDEDAMPFPAVLVRLAAAGVERYHADLARAEKTFYMPDGASTQVACAPLQAVPAAEFDADGVEAAVRSVQAGRLSYHGFCAAIAEAGCVGYHVTMLGRRAVYYGRTGDSHVEAFPQVS